MLLLFFLSVTALLKLDTDFPIILDSFYLILTANQSSDSLELSSMCPSYFRFVLYCDILSDVYQLTVDKRFFFFLTNLFPLVCSLLSIMARLIFFIGLQRTCLRRCTLSLVTDVNKLTCALFLSPSYYSLSSISEH